MDCLELIHLYENRIKEQDNLITDILQNNDFLAHSFIVGLSIILLVSFAPNIYEFFKNLIKRR